MRPPWLLALSVAGTALLLHLANGGAPEILPAQAAIHEGQTVRVEGLVTDVWSRDGVETLTLLRDGHALEARAPTTGITAGAWASATGRLLRSGGALVLWVESATDVEATMPGDVQEPGWHAVAADPYPWAGRPITLVGEVQKRTLQGSGAALALGAGPWPEGGSVRATGAIAYDPGCMCHRFHAQEVQPWTA